MPLKMPTPTKPGLEVNPDITSHHLRLQEDPVLEGKYPRSGSQKYGSRGCKSNIGRSRVTRKIRKLQTRMNNALLTRKGESPVVSIKLCLLSPTTFGKDK